jgi:hypothetical protein
MKELASKVGDAAQDFASKAGDTAQNIGEKGVSVSKDFLSKFGGTAQDIGAEGLQASKKIIGKAGDTVQDIGEKGKLNIEIMQLESKARKLMERLGAEAYGALVEQKLSSVSLSTPAIKNVIQELDTLQKEIDKKKRDLEK